MDRKIVLAVAAAAALAVPGAVSAALGGSSGSSPATRGAPVLPVAKQVSVVKSPSTARHDGTCHNTAAVYDL
jgi:hypothetical protein